MILHQVTIDMVPGGPKPEIWLNQYDSDFTIRFDLVARRGEFTAPTGTTAAIRGTKPDGNGFSADAVISGSTVTVTGDQQMTVVAGKAYYELTLYKSGKELNTANFILNVERAALDMDTPTSRSQTRELVALEERADEIIAAVEHVSDAEAYAIGTRDGEPVPSTDPAYNNSAKYWAEHASGENLAPQFSTSTAYAVGDYVLYNNHLYRFTSAHAAGAWNAAHATAVTTMAEVTDLKGDLSVLEPSATSSDIGKTLMVKTVSDGKVTEYEFGESSGSGFVRYDTAQSLTDAQKTQARGNIGVIQQYYEINIYNTIPSVGTILFTNADIDIGDTILYFIVMSQGAGTHTTGFIDIIDTSNNRITYLGKGSSSDPTKQFNGEYIIPQNFSYAKWNGDLQPTSLNIKKRSITGKGIVRYDSDQILTDSQKTKARNNIGIEEQIANSIYSGNCVNNQVLFDNSKASSGQLIFIDATFPSSGSTILSFFDENDVRLSYFGKMASSMTQTHFKGIVVLPDNFDYCKIQGPDGYSTTVNAEIFNNDKQNALRYVESYSEDSNLLDYCGFLPNYLLKVKNDTLVQQNGYCVTSYVSVIPGSMLKSTSTFVSTTFGTVFYDANQEMVNCQVSNYPEILVPKNACYARFTLKFSEAQTCKITYKMPYEVSHELANPYKRYDVHRYGTLLNKRFNHVAFPFIDIFSGGFVITYKCGSMHGKSEDTSVVDPNWGNFMLDTISFDGEHKHVKLFNLHDDFGLPTDADGSFNLSTTKDGDYLIMVGGGNYAISGDTFSRIDMVITCLDKEFNIIDYQVIQQYNKWPQSPVLITPDGYVITAGWDTTDLHTIGIIRSNEVFAGSVANLTFSWIPIATYSEVGRRMSEVGLGYFNDKLVAVCRTDSGNNYAFVKYTQNLEGIDGWSNAIDLNMAIDDPLLPHYRKGKYLPVFATRKYSDHRDPYLVYLNSDDFTISFSGCVDDSLLESRNGYISGVPLGDENFAVVYYQEATIPFSQRNFENSFTAVYYKWINARAIVPELNYVDLTN